MTELNSINNKLLSLESTYMGLMDYSKSVELQNDLFCLSEKSLNSYVIGLEHPAVMTLGHRANIKDEIYNENILPIQRTSRGGLATIHSEGQLVIYPVINLRELNLGVREYVILLLQTTQDLLKSFDVESFIDDKSVGLYTQKGKIAFCGVHIKNGISQHGLSLNIRNDLSLFEHIRSCGVNKPSFDRLSDYNINCTLSELYEKWTHLFKLQLIQKTKQAI